jgi:hypothetical protein
MVTIVVCEKLSLSAGKLVLEDVQPIRLQIKKERYNEPPLYSKRVKCWIKLMMFFLRGAARQVERFAASAQLMAV